MIGKVIGQFLFFWLPQVFIVTFVCFVAFSTSQQVLRQSANYPQVQMAEDTASALAAGKSAGEFLGNSKVDIGKSLAPYVVIYDKAGRPATGSGLLEGNLPMMPEGVFRPRFLFNKDRFTWEPRDGVRSAVVWAKINGQSGGYVVAGRSLRETENIVQRLGLMVLAAWVGGLGVSAAGAAILVFGKYKKLL